MTGRVRGGRFAARRVVAAGVGLVLTGRPHAPFVQPLPFGDGMTYAAGAGTLSLRERGAPPGFGVIQTFGEELSVSAMALDGRSLAVDWARLLSLRPRAGEGG